MTLQAFFNKYTDRFVDFDGQFGAQCVDLYRQYCQEVLQVPQSPPVNGAADIWNNYLKGFFTQISNTPTGIPQLGDILIWSKKLNGIGHVAICVTADLDTFTSFDQNWPLASACHFQQHTYKNLLGWLHKK